MYTFKVLEANTSDHPDLIASMHKLRYDIFHKELQWSVGLDLQDDQEKDQYDRPGTFYIVRVNTHGDVDATCRLMPTNKPYMLQEHYPRFISKEPIPESSDVWEISRSAASIQARKETPKILSELLTATIEFGLANDIKRFVSLTTVDKLLHAQEKKPNLFRMLTAVIGWDSKPMGELLDTPDDKSYALAHSVSFEMLEHFRKRHHFDKPFLYDFEQDDIGNITKVKELWHDNLIIRENLTETPRGTTGISPGGNLRAVLS